MDLDNINDKTIDLITDAVIKKMLYKFKQEYHQMSTPMSVADLMKGFMPFRESPEEFLLAEMARLHTLLALYEGKEEFMKAAIIKRRLEIIQTKAKTIGERFDDNIALANHEYNVAGSAKWLSGLKGGATLIGGYADYKKIKYNRATATKIP